MDGSWADREAICDVVLAETELKESQHGSLALGQSGRVPLERARELVDSVCGRVQRLSRRPARSGVVVRLPLLTGELSLRLTDTAPVRGVQIMQTVETV